MTGRRMVEQYRWDVVAHQVEDYYYACLDAAAKTRSENGNAWQRTV
jgi:hypothetical protein